MAWSVPAFVGGANHPVEVARLLAYAAFERQEGVLDPLDCRVRALATPGTSIRVAPGGTNILAKGAGDPRQSYASFLTSEDVVAVSPTDASGGRSDLVIARVEDPNIAGGGWQNPGVNGPFQFTRILPGVPATTHDVKQVRSDYSAITLARIDIPANTGTITDAMITDLRSLAEYGGQRIVVIENPPATPPPIATSVYADNKRVTSGTVLPGSNSSYITFPSEGVWRVPVPTWATGVDVFCDVNPVTGGHAWGYARMLINGVPGVSIEFDENFAGPTGGWYRVMLRASGTQPIPASVRGKVTEFRLQARQRAGEGFTLGDLTANLGTFLTFLLVFQRHPVYT